MPPLPRAYHDWTSWPPRPVGQRPRVEPVLDPDVGLAEVLARHVGPGGEEDEAEHQVAGPARGDPQQADEQGEQQGREPDVVLEAHHQDGEAPGQDDRDQRPGVEDQAVAEPGRRDRQQLALVGEVGGEEDAEHDLADLDRLELERPDLDPQPGALDVAADAGDEGQQQQEDPDGQQQVAVAVEVAGPADHGQGDHVGGHAAGRPGRLERGVVG